MNHFQLNEELQKILERKTNSIERTKSNFYYDLGVTSQNYYHSYNNEQFEGFTYSQKIRSLISLNVEKYLQSLLKHATIKKELKNKIIQDINIQELHNAFIIANDLCEELGLMEREYVASGKKLFDLKTKNGKELFAAIYTMYIVLRRINIAIDFLMEEILLEEGFDEKDSGNKIYLLINQYGKNLNKPRDNANKETKINYYYQVAINQINSNIPLLVNISEYIFHLILKIHHTNENWVRLGGGKKRKTTTKKSTKSKTKKSIKIKKSASKK